MLDAAKLTCLLFGAGILCSLDVHKARSALLILVFLASSSVYCHKVIQVRSFS